MNAEIKSEAIASYREGDIVIINGMDELEHIVSANTNMTILLMCKKGKIQIIINGKLIVMEDSDLLFILPNSKIRDMLFSADINCSAICICSMRVQNFLRTQDLLNMLFTIRKNPLLHVNEKQFQELVLLKENVKRIFSSTHPYYERIMSHFVEIILYDIFGSYKACMEQIVSPDMDVPNRANQLFAEFINMLHADKGRQREVCYFAGRLYITPKYLSAVCKQVSGKTCSQWISETVVDEIKHLLCYTDLSIKEIADMLNFENHSFFSKYVRRYLGCPPKYYRKKYRVSNQ